jgi:hypothetical protein
VHAKDLFPVLQIHPDEELVLGVAGGMNEEIEMARPSQGLLENAFHLLGVGDIRGQKFSVFPKL